jgi:hypothetical protein
VSEPRAGTKYRHTAEQGLAARARVADPSVSDDLHPDMAELDMPPGCVVTVIAYDAERDLALAEWTDGQGNQRITSLDTGDLADNFEGLPDAD